MAHGYRGCLHRKLAAVHFFEHRESGAGHQAGPAQDEGGLLPEAGRGVVEMMARRANLTDRALRYRAVKNHPPGEKRCAFCGSKSNIEVGHIDGHEEHTDDSNLIWTCRSCNVLAANS